MLNVGQHAHVRQRQNSTLTPNTAAFTQIGSMLEAAGKTIK